jgi:hypothetical protein
MGPKAILDAAYRAGVVPEHLRGKTQHKTLQARLSEDILHHRQASAFYRTEPGQFALTEFIEDPEFPSKWKTPFPARRRTRELKSADTLSVRCSVAEALKNNAISLPEFIQLVATSGDLSAMHPSEMEEQEYCSIWTFTVVRKNDRILSYRIGRYRDNRDAFANKQSIGFPGALTASDVSLFSTDQIGAEDCATSVLLQDLDLSLAAFEQPQSSRPSAEAVTAITGMDEGLDIVILLSWESPDWFEPTTRRLSLNEPRWLYPHDRPNDIDDFEPWSAWVLQWLSKTSDQKPLGTEKNNGSASCLP